MKTPFVVQTVYIYLFSLIGLVLVTIGGVRLFDMGLRAFIFTRADEAQRMASIPPYPPAVENDIKAISQKNTTTEEEKAALERWMSDYKEWKARDSERDYVAESRSRDASQSLALIAVGLPLYLYHWFIARKELSKKEEQ